MGEKIRGLCTGTRPPAQLRRASDLLQYAPTEWHELPMWFDVLNDEQFVAVWPTALYECKALASSISQVMVVIDSVRYRYSIMRDEPAPRRKSPQPTPAQPQEPRDTAPSASEQSEPCRSPTEPERVTKARESVAAPPKLSPKPPSVDLDAAFDQWKRSRIRRRGRTAEDLLKFERHYIEQRKPVKIKHVLTVSPNNSQYVCLVQAVSKDPLWRKCSSYRWEFAAGPDALRDALVELGLIESGAPA